MKEVIITGATGVIGIALIHTLLKQRVHITAVCRSGSDRKKNIPECKEIDIIDCNLNALSELVTVLKNRSFDVFYHLGWEGTAGKSRNNMQVQLRNIQYTLDAVEAAYALGCHTFIGAGSQAEYGRTEEMLNAQVPAFPENAYGIAKLCAGQMSRILCEQKGIKHVWARILSVYGPYDNEKSMIMSTIYALLRGNRATLTKGEQQWDYLFSMDAGRALYLLGEKGVNGKVYCIGSGKTKQLTEYLKILSMQISDKAELGFGDIPYGDKQVMYLCADISELQQDTGFIPEYDFADGIKETIKWCKKQKYE